ncbi:hypothetical protein ACFXPW_09335 [Streptomyces goshikiensis]|uniref:hypothetical protein n=1 Tax=Streptomyces goshikiensis TaxID=1942 RepID=UPI0036843D4E
MHSIADQRGAPATRYPAERLAARIAASAPASPAYGLPGSTHTASNPAGAPAAASADARAVGIQYAS